ncbi:hypothetical protein Hdeb2414_s0459g00898361 [Helianthus debilis subsp. tardiflorus]
MPRSNATDNSCRPSADSVPPLLFQRRYIATVLGCCHAKIRGPEAFYSR